MGGSGLMTLTHSPKTKRLEVVESPKLLEVLLAAMKRNEARLF
jgi:hypothetical protein